MVGASLSLSWCFNPLFMSFVFDEAVRAAQYGSLREPETGGPRAAPVQHPRLRVERQVEAQQERPQTSAGTSTQRQSNRPPSTARTYYKVVACEDATSGRFVSIYDGRTRYAMDTTTSPAGGAWVCPDLLSVVQHASTLPSRSARLNAPRVILQVLGWNSQGREPVVSPAHAGSTTKRLVSHVRPVAVLPYTAAGQPGTPVGLEDFLTEEVATLSSADRPRTAPAAPRPVQLTMRSGEAARTFGGTVERAQRLQAMTAALHEDVLNAQARLERVRAVADVSGTLDDPGAPPRDWMRRALARINPTTAPAPPPPPNAFAVGPQVSVR